MMTTCGGTQPPVPQHIRFLRESTKQKILECDTQTDLGFEGSLQTALQRRAKLEQTSKQDLIDKVKMLETELQITKLESIEHQTMIDRLSRETGRSGLTPRQLATDLSKAGIFGLDRAFTGLFPGDGGAKKSGLFGEGKASSGGGGDSSSSSSSGEDKDGLKKGRYVSEMGPPLDADLSRITEGVVRDLDRLEKFLNFRIEEMGRDPEEEARKKAEEEAERARKKAEVGRCPTREGKWILT